MKNIEFSQGSTTYRDDRPSEVYVRFSANFDDEAEALDFQMDLLQCVTKFQVAIAAEKNKEK